MFKWEISQIKQLASRRQVFMIRFLCMAHIDGLDDLDFLPFVQRVEAH